MRKTIIGLTIGFIIGLIDLIPMIIQKLTRDDSVGGRGNDRAANVIPAKAETCMLMA